MKISQPLLSLYLLSALQVDAFPHLKPRDVEALSKQMSKSGDCPYSAIKKQAKRQIVFDPATQYVSTTGEHAFVAPNFLAGDQRGPCPGLNALANHGYLPHSGVADLLTITEAVNTGKSAHSSLIPGSALL